MLQDGVRVGAADSSTSTGCIAPPCQMVVPGRGSLRSACVTAVMHLPGFSPWPSASARHLMTRTRVRDAQAAGRYVSVAVENAQQLPPEMPKAVERGDTYAPATYFFPFLSLSWLQSEQRPRDPFRQFRRAHAPSEHEQARRALSVNETTIALPHLILLGCCSCMNCIGTSTRAKVFAAPS